jgi:hypothetical protein
MEALNTKLMNSLMAVLGALVGAVTMWFTVKDRLVSEVKEKVTEQVLTASKLARLEERTKAQDEKLKSLETAIATLQQK